MASLFALVVCMAASAVAESAETPITKETPDAGKAAAARSLSLADIAARLEAVDSSERDMRRRLAESARDEAQASEIDAAERALSQTGRVGVNGPVDLVEYFEATDLEIAIRAIVNRLDSTIETIAARARQLDEDLDRLASDSAQSNAWVATARLRQAPAALLAAIEAVPKRGDELARQIRAERDRLLQILDRAQRLRRGADISQAEVADRKLALATHLRTASEAPIWRISVTRGELDRSLQAAHSRAVRILDHMHQHASIVLAITIVAFGLCYALIIVTRRQLAHGDGTDPRGRSAKRLFDAPIAAALFVSLLALLRYGPVGSVGYYELLVSLLLVPAALLACAMFGEQLKVTLYTLAAVLISLTWFGPVVDPLPLASRLLLIAQCIAVAAALAWDLHHGNLADAFPTQSPAVTRSAAIAMIALLVLAVAASFVGATGAARFLRNLGLGGLGLALILSIAMHLLYGLIVALTQTRPARSLRIFRERPEAVHRFARRVFIAVAFACWTVAMAQVLGLFDRALRLGGEVVSADIQVGAAHVELRGIFVGLAVLVTTYLVVTIVRFVLEVGLLPRVHLKHGIAFAISAVVRYVLLTAGVLLAIAAMGIDLTKVTLLAGALGVGIGLGLQGVVNNFVSGLILLVERPISAGDSVQIGDVQGTVRKIGVRSTTIATGQGAEIIVPNAELISKPVTNWTLTDRRRKLEIDVSVTRGADPESVMRGLEETASTIDGVAAEPSPRAWLTGFRDNSLDYRLHAWVGDVDRALAVQSALRTAIARKFTFAATDSA